MPFFSFLPIGTDVQPLFLLFIFPLMLLDKTYWKFNKFELYFLFIALLSIVYSIENITYKSLLLLISFFIYHTYRKYLHLFNDKILYIVVIINFIAVLMHFFLPELFINTIGHFVRIVKITDAMNSARGASGFAAEPGFMGTLSVVYMLLSFYLKDYRKRNNYHIKILILSIIILLLTKSGSATLFILIFSLFYFYKKIFKVKYFFIGFVLIIITIVLINSDLHLGRGASILKLLFSNPEFIFIHDPSVGQRSTNILLGVLSPFYFPIGIIDKSPYDYAYNILSNQVDIFSLIAGSKSNISYFALYSAQLGFFFFLLIIFIIFNILMCGINKLKIASFFIGFLIMSVSYSIIFPIIWLLFSIAIRKEKME